MHSSSMKIVQTMLDHLWTQAHFRSDELPDAKPRLLIPGVFDGTQLFEVEADGRCGGITAGLKFIMLQVCNSRRFAQGSAAGSAKVRSCELIGDARLSE